MAVADRNGLPVAVGIASGERGEVALVHDVLEQRFVDELPANLIGDKAYDSNKLDAELKAKGVEMIAPVNSRHTRNKQDRRRLRRYRRRWKVERLFAWMMRFRRVVTRYERKAENFFGSVKLACIAILLRRV